MSRLLLCRRVALRHALNHVRPPLTRLNRPTVVRRWQSSAASQQERIAAPRWHDGTLTGAQRNRIHNAPLLRYVEAYRMHGHKRARIDPLGLTPTPAVAELDPTQYGLHPDEAYDVSGIVDLPFASSHATGEQIQRHLEQTYCSSIAAEFTHLHSAAQRDFFSNRLESITPAASLSPAERRNIHSLLLQSATFDRFMSIKFPSTKRYGLEGAEALLPALDAVFAAASQQGVQQTVLAMPHRGRLNVLVALLDFQARALFSKVQGKSWVPSSMQGYCDVLSHASTTVTKKFDAQHSLTVSLLPNPSHLEAINPVSQGRVRAEQQLLASKSPGLSLEEQRRAVLCVQVHGDAAFSGQGVVAEALTLANLPDFSVGGTVHLICNNQIGFTAARDKGRSSPYSSDMGKLIGCPVLHVNADDVDAVVYACRLAVDYRHAFHEDVIVDIVGYRRLGHNEVDEPRFTQPTMYKHISDRQSVVEAYGRELESAGLLRKETSERLVARLMSHLEAELAESQSHAPSAEAYFQKEWAGYSQASHCYDHVNTGVDANVLREVALASVALPPSFHIHPRLLRSHVEARRQAVSSAGAASIDWATAEAMALGTLLREGYDVRMCGQDVERGTFSHRHAVLFDQHTNAAHTPFHHAGYPGRAHFVSSNLSEFGVLGFEYGYSLTSPHTLSMWEAQFGDFINTAQTVVDNFIASGETKWLKSTGLVLLLPHGQDPTGPEHVTCRIERFLQLSDDDPTHSSESTAPLRPVNLLVANPSTPAQYFHLLRRQMQRHYRKPLVVAAPKVLLRHSACVSRVDDMERGRTFLSVLGDEAMAGREAEAEVLVLCSGKLYYDLVDERTKRGRTNIAFVRLEELSPYPWLDVQQQLEAYCAGGLRRVVWAQEEPMNAGAWSFVSARLQRQLGQTPLEYAGRPPMASAATGSTEQHKTEVKALLDAVFA